MGIFDKIKENITHGGVSLSVSASNSFGTDIPVTITITSSEERSVKELTVSLIMQKTVQEATDARRTVEEIKDTNHSTDPFLIAPNQTQTINLTLDKPFDIDSSATYTIKAVANVEGIALDPSDETRLAL